MVTTTFRILLLWLLALALPAQGYAASTMVFCSASHSRAAIQVAPEAAIHGHADHDHRSQAATDPTAATADPSSGQCSVCATCCHQVAIAALPLVPDRAPSTRVYVASSFEPLASVYPSGLERPPRILLA